MERIFDVIISGLALIFLAPILLACSLVLKFTGEGEVFFRQQRKGWNGNIFNLIKFATMLKDSPSIGTGTVTVKNDPRILPIGKFLRKTKINELPQLINVLFGEMSLIGPRPLTPNNFRMYCEETQNVIELVRPGLSGIGSIIFRDEEGIMSGEQATLTFYQDHIAPYKGALEVWFVNNRGLKLYFIIIFLTIWIIFFPTSKVVWRTLKNLPAPPENLKKSLKYPY